MCGPTTLLHLQRPSSMHFLVNFSFNSTVHVLGMITIQHTAKAYIYINVYKTCIFPKYIHISICLLFSLAHTFSLFLWDQQHKVIQPFLFFGESRFPRTLGPGLDTPTTHPTLHHPPSPNRPPPTLSPPPPPPVHSDPFPAAPGSGCLMRESPGGLCPAAEPCPGPACTPASKHR